MAFKSNIIQHLEYTTGSTAITNDLYSHASTSRTLLAANPEKVRSIGALIEAAAKEIGCTNMDQFKKNVDEYAEKDQSFTSHRTTNRRARICASWLAVVNLYKPEITIETVFNYSIVKEHILKFLPIMVKILKPQKGHAVIRSSTLVEAYDTFVSLVVKFTYDDAGINKKGFELLTKDGYFVALQNQLKALIIDHKLERTMRKKFFFGREHVHVLLSTMLSETENEAGRRATVIQGMARILLTFYSTCRPSTMGYTEKKWREAERYPKLQDVRIYRKGYMKYEIEITLKNFKGAINTTDADQQIIKLHPVLFAHNALFDPTIAFIALFFVRGDFKTKYKTINEFCNDHSAEILLDPKKIQDPLFLQLREGGRSFVNPPQPSSAEAASSTLAWWCQMAGLPKQGVTALRRDAGNMYGQQLGIKVARVIMNHRDGFQVFNKHYSRGTDNLQLVNVRLGEVRGSKESKEGEALETNRGLHVFNETVIECIVRFQHKSASEIKTEQQIQRRSDILASAKPDVSKVWSTISGVYAEYLKCFTGGVGHYGKPSKANMTRIWNMATGETTSRYGIAFHEEMKDNATKFRDDLSSLFSDSTAAKKKHNRTAVRDDKFQQTRSYFTGGLSGTTEERLEAEKTLDQRMQNEVKQAVDTYKGKMFRLQQDEVVEITPKMLENYRQNNSNEPDSCEFQGDVAAWRNELSREIQLQQELDEEDEEDKNLVRLIKNNCNNPDAPENKEEPVPFTADDDELLTIPDVDESLESDVLKIPVDEVRRALLESYLAPVMKERAVQVIDEEGNKRYPCNICVSRGVAKGTGFKTHSHYDRHQKQCHSEWKELEHRMKGNGSSRLSCPSRDFEANSVKKIYDHMSSNCVDVEIYLPLKISHHEAVDHYHEPKYTAESNEVVEGTDQMLLRLEHLFNEWVKEDGEEVVEHSVNWDTLGLDEGLDFYTFTTTTGFKL